MTALAAAGVVAGTGPLSLGKTWDQHFSEFDSFPASRVVGDICYPCFSTSAVSVGVVSSQKRPSRRL
jgi:hypothetical protein